ncbi:MAG: nitroreductase family protein [Candidatus Omnitrophota bacterium]
MNLDIIKKRRSVREFQDKPISREVLENIIDLARFAPTARNIQPWEFIVITNKDILNKLGVIIADNGKFIAQASTCVAVFCSDTKYYLEDGSAATQNLLLAATGFDIGSCWVAGDKKPYAQEVSNLLNVPATFKLVSLVALGYPKSKNIFKVAQKRPLKEIIHWEKF